MERFIPGDLQERFIGGMSSEKIMKPHTVLIIFSFRHSIQGVSSLAPRGLTLLLAQRSRMETSLNVSSLWVDHLLYFFGWQKTGASGLMSYENGLWESITQQIPRWKVKQRLALLILSLNGSQVPPFVSLPLRACAPVSIHKHTQVCTSPQPLPPGLTQPWSITVCPLPSWSFWCIFQRTDLNLASLKVGGVVDSDIDHSAVCILQNTGSICCFVLCSGGPTAIWTAELYWLVNLHYSVQNISMINNY